MRRIPRLLVPALVVAGLYATPAPAYGVTITVNANIDAIANDSNCTLREAIISANTGTPPATGCVAGADNAVDTISIPLASPQLGIAPGTESQPGETGDLDVTEDLIITGAGAASTTINGAGVDRVFEVISASATLTVEDVTVRGGAADEAGLAECRGGAFRVAHGALVVNDALLATNVAGEGGAIYADGSADVTLNNVEIDANQSQKNGGAIVTSDSTTLTINNSVITDNSQVGVTQFSPPCTGVGSFGGGALYLSGTGGTTISDTTIARNTANQGNGGGLFTFAANSNTIERSTISDNAVNNGHGAAARIGSGSILDVTNSTISGNTSVGVDGMSNAGTLRLHSSTTSDQDFGISTDVAATTQIDNSIIDDGCLGDLPTSLDHNIETGNTCGFTEGSDQPSTNADLGPLAANGGPTQTHALGGGSPAIDAGLCTGLATDQRDVPRQGDGCDVGAFESAPTTATATFPNGAFTTSAYAAGCGNPSFQEICGTSTGNPDGDPVIIGVQVRIKRALNNQFWNAGTAQFQVAEVWNPAVGTSSWTFDFAPGLDDAFEVTARATDSVGYVGEGAPVSFAIDNAAPGAPSIDSVSASKRRNRATLTFAGAEPGGTFQCQRDGKTFLPCTSPLTYKRLKDGKHTFSVRQVDAAGNVGAVASVTFRV